MDTIKELFMLAYHNPQALSMYTVLIYLFGMVVIELSKSIIKRRKNG